MIVFLTLLYVALVGLLVWMGKIPNSAKTWFTVPIWMVLLLIVLFFPMQLGAPSGPVRLMTYSTSVIPNVAGTVTEVVAQPNQPLKKGDVLFRIDQRPFQYLLEAKKAALAEAEQKVPQLKTSLAAATATFEQARANRDRSKQTYDRYAAGNRAGTRPFSEQQVEVRRLTYLADEAALRRAIAAEEQARLAATSEIDGVNTTVARLRAEVDKAEYDLEQTTVRAPADGYVTFVALSPGQRITPLPLQPAMTFIHTSNRIVLAHIGQIYHRHLEPGQRVELAFKARAGKIFGGVVEALIQVSGQGQAQTTGTVPLPPKVEALPFYVRIKMDDDIAANNMPAGTVGSAAIYTQSATMTHIIRKVMIRMDSYMNYLVPTM